MTIAARRETVYRRYVRTCCVCRAYAPIELHVGTGGNYISIFVCWKHDATPKQPSPRLIAADAPVRPSQARVAENAEAEPPTIGKVTP